MLLLQCKLILVVRRFIYFIALRAIGERRIGKFHNNRIPNETFVHQILKYPFGNKDKERSF